jgi:hypothetical protein
MPPSLQTHLQGVEKLRPRPSCSVARSSKMLTYARYAALFEIACVLHGDLILCFNALLRNCRLTIAATIVLADHFHNFLSWRFPFPGQTAPFKLLPYRPVDTWQDNINRFRRRYLSFCFCRLPDSPILKAEIHIDNLALTDQVAYFSRRQCIGIAFFQGNGPDPGHIQDRFIKDFRVKPGVYPDFVEPVGIDLPQHGSRFPDLIFGLFSHYASVQKSRPKMCRAGFSLKKVDPDKTY